MEGFGGMEEQDFCPWDLCWVWANGFRGWTFLKEGVWEVALRKWDWERF